MAMKVLGIVLIAVADAASAAGPSTWGAATTEDNWSSAGSALTLISASCCNGPSQCNDCFGSRPSCCSGPSACGECLSSHAEDEAAPSSSDVQVNAHLLTEFDTHFTVEGHTREGSAIHAHGTMTANTELGQGHLFFSMQPEHPTRFVEVLPGMGRVDGVLHSVDIDLAFDSVASFGSLRVKAVASSPPVIEAPVTLSACVSLTNMDFTQLKMLMAMQSEQMVTAYTQQMQSMPHTTDSDDSSLYTYHPQGAPPGVHLEITKADGMPAKMTLPGSVITFDWRALPSGYDGFHQMECRAPGTSAEITNLMGRQDVKIAHVEIEKLRRQNPVFAAALPMDLLSILNQAKGTAQDQECQSRSNSDLFGAVAAAFAVGSLATFATVKSLSKQKINVPQNTLG